ncbi:hypothetical protein R3P38DRAFT_2951182 [Favolaschia claudopus]|uniref:Uncharacterized protein n=1 Tax=Favolaschia claudopus TaxID=2862362 RepID=A0AAW0BDJ4_9AGAR
MIHVPHPVFNPGPHSLSPGSLPMKFLPAALFNSCLLLALIAPVACLQNFTECSGVQLDWYTKVVGETPCRTYERLRQTCNPIYQVGKMNSSMPPDLCHDGQGTDCCCNSIAFTLSMLCLNCQQPIGTGTGYDAPPKTMQRFWNASYDGTRKSSCSKPIRGDLPQNIQKAVCNQNIPILDGLYSKNWPDGSWYYVYTRNHVHENNLGNDNNSLTHCPKTNLVSPPFNQTTTSLDAVESATNSPSASQSTSPRAFSTAAAAGLPIGIISVVAGIIACCLIWRRRRRMAAERSKRQTQFFPPPVADALGRPLPTVKKVAPRKGQSMRLLFSTNRRTLAARSRPETLPPAYHENKDHLPV